MDTGNETKAQSAEGLVSEWRSEAQHLERRGLLEASGIVRSLADQLEAVLALESSVVLTLKEAAAESGYSADHLGKLVREGAIPNAGRHGAPRIRRRDLPRRGGGLTRSSHRLTLRSSKAAIVRSIATQGS